MPKLHKTISEKEFNVETINRALAEIKDDRPRGAVAFGSSLLENLLSTSLQEIMVQLSKSEKDQIFVGNGPLSSFSARIKVAYALGIFGKKTKHDLDTVREIRNAIVHSQHIVGFEEKEVVNLITNMHCIKFLGKDAPKETNLKFALSIEIVMRNIIDNVSLIQGDKFERTDFGLD